MLLKSAFPLFILVLTAIPAAQAGSCKVSLLSLGDVVHLTAAQARALSITDSRYAIVQDQDEKKGPGFRPVLLKGLKGATQEQPVNLKRGDASKHFKKPEEEDVERVGTMTVGTKTVPRKTVSPYDTAISIVESGTLVRTEGGEFWVVLNWKKLAGFRSGGGSDFVPEEKRLEVQRFQLSEEGTDLVSESKTMSVGGWNFEKDVRVKSIAPVMKGYEIAGPLKPHLQKTVRSRFTEGDVFRYKGKAYLVKNAYEGTYREQGSRPTATWELVVFEIKEKDFSKLESTESVEVRNVETSTFTQEGGYHGYLGDFTGPVEYFGNYSFTPNLDTAKISKLIKGDKEPEEAGTVEVPVVYDLVPTP